MAMETNVFYYILYCVIFNCIKISFSTAELYGGIADCKCSVDELDSFNNLQIYPRLQSILQKDYFRYWKVNLKKNCEFWQDDGKCTLSFCSVKPCNNVPNGLKKNIKADSEELSLKHKKEKYLNKKSHEELEVDCEDENQLSYLNTTISKESEEKFLRWGEHDSSQEDSFCYLDDESSDDNEYVDLLLNPERFTGYSGEPSRRVWRAIYRENCFDSPTTSPDTFPSFPNIKEMCLEKRTFYRAVSGLHSSINVHLCSKYLLKKDLQCLEGFVGSTDGVWGPNFEEFQCRFGPKSTDGLGDEWLKNLYFLYLLELKAINKVAPYLRSLPFYTGNADVDVETKEAVADIFDVIESFPHHFDEKEMFSANIEAVKLKTQFRDRFRNISKIMDCVGCAKCRVWGKLQVTGLGTSLKILFSEKFKNSENSENKFTITRNEIVALFNAFGRLSNSIASLQIFRDHLKTDSVPKTEL